jgi:hypothetical protein
MKVIEQPIITLNRNLMFLYFSANLMKKKIDAQMNKMNTKKNKTKFIFERNRITLWLIFTVKSTIYRETANQTIDSDLLEVPEVDNLVIN